MPQKCDSELPVIIIMLLFDVVGVQCKVYRPTVVGTAWADSGVQRLLIYF